MKEPKIRFAQYSDLDELVRLCKLHAHFEKCNYDSKHKAKKLNSHLFSEEPSLYCLIAEHENQLIGYATYMKQFSTWDCAYYIYMDCLFLSENARSFGIGVKLIDRIKIEGTKLACSHIQWQTPNFNIRAMKFYDRIGASSKSKERYFLTI